MSTVYQSAAAVLHMKEETTMPEMTPEDVAVQIGDLSHQLTGMAAALAAAAARTEEGRPPPFGQMAAAYAADIALKAEALDRARRLVLAELHPPAAGR